MHNVAKARRIQLKIVMALMMVVFLAIAFLMAITVYSADDYWYSVFMDGGLENFLELTRYHYETFNGRVLVHIAAQAILHCGNWLFALIGIAVCLWIPCSAALSTRQDKKALPITVLLFGAGILAMPRDIMVQGLLWISAFCNYALPTAMVCFEIWFLSRITGAERCRAWIWPACAVCGFLCGATTEQSGLISVAVALFYCAVCLVSNRKRLLAPLLSAAFAFLGLLTIFMSPATEARFSQETDASSLTAILASLCDGFEEQAMALGGSRITAVLLAVLFAAAGFALTRSTRKKWVFFAWIFPAAISLATPFAGGDTLVALYAAVFAFLLVTALALVIARRREESVFILAAVASILVMLPTNSSGPRILLPFYLYLLAAAAVLLGENADLFRPSLCIAGLAAAAAAALLLRIPMFAGCWANYMVDRTNHQSAIDAQESGVLYYCIDYDMRYTHTKAFSDGYFYDKYLESIGLDDADVDVYLYSNNTPCIYAGGKQTVSPALLGTDGGYLLPLRNIVENLGGSIKIEESGTVRVFLSGLELAVDFPSVQEALVSWVDSSGNEQKLTVEKAAGYFQTCLGMDIFTQALGLSVTYEPDRNRLVVELAS